MRKLLFFFMCISSFACNQTNEVVENITVSAKGLPQLHSGEGHYQLWATFFQFNKRFAPQSPMHEGEFVSLGKFLVAENGTLRGLDGSVAEFHVPPGRSLQLLQDIVISIQPATQVHDDEPGPIILGGKFFGDASRAHAELTISYVDALNAGFASAVGQCTIIAPTSPADSNAGVWFVESGTTISAGLRNVPRLPMTWKYEGWVIERANNQTIYHSTGKFSRADSADLDGAGITGGSGAPLNFPGQDFVTGAFRPSLTDGKFAFMISIEPFPDNAEGPFFLRLFETSTNPGLVLPRKQPMQNVMSASSPTARVVIQRP